MAEEQNMDAHYAEMDTTAHRHTYGGFLTMVKWGTVGAVLVGALAVILIS